MAIVWSGFWTLVIMKFLEHTVGVWISMDMEETGMVPFYCHPLEPSFLYWFFICLSTSTLSSYSLLFLLPPPTNNNVHQQDLMWSWESRHTEREVPRMTVLLLHPRRKEDSVPILLLLATARNKYQLLFQSLQRDIGRVGDGFLDR